MSATRPAGPDEPGPLNPAQRAVVDQLGASASERPVFPDGLALGLRTLIDDGIEPVIRFLPADETIWMSKYELAQVLACEAKFVHERSQPFAWNVMSARGTVAHKAIELSVHWRAVPLAAELVDEALGRLGGDGSSIAGFLIELPEGDRAQLRSEAANATQSFLDGFPPLRHNPQWRPSVEVRGRVELLEHRLVLAGKIDLSLGGPSGDRSGRVFIDLKTGRRHRSHVDDLRYYALIETLRYGTPPRAVANYYLDESRLSTESVTTDLLWAAAERVVAATSRWVELVHRGAEPEYRPSLACRWCPIVSSCESGRRFLDETHDDEHDLLG